MRSHYSRLASSEEKRNIRRAATFLFLSLAAVIVLLTFGLPTIAKFAAFLTDLRKTAQPVEKNDTTPPSPPQVSSLPDATNKSALEVSGSAEAASTVILTFNTSDEEVVADRDGKYVFSLTRKKGENKLAFKAKDAAGNESQKTQTYVVLFDEDEPKIEIGSPSDGSEFFGSMQRQVTIQGTSEAEAALTINDRPIKVEDDGSFTYATTLSEGDNIFNLKATDKAGNVTEKSLTLKFSP